MIESTQDKQKEISFFDGHAAADSYDVFTPESNLRLIRTCTGLAKWKSGARVADLGCGSGVFTNLLRQQGFRRGRARPQPEAHRLGSSQIS